MNDSTKCSLLKPVMKVLRSNKIQMQRLIFYE